jgi:hypothetical protein
MAGNLGSSPAESSMVRKPLLASMILANALVAQLYPVGNANIPVPVSNGGVTVSAVTIYTPYPPSAAGSDWQLVILAVTVAHPQGMQFAIAGPCTTPTSGTWFAFDSGAGTFRLEVVGTGPTLPGYQTSVLQVPVSVPPFGATCTTELQPAYYPWTLRVQGGSPTSIGPFMVGPHLISANSLWLSPAAAPQIGTYFPIDIHCTSGGVATPTGGTPIFYIVGFSMAIGSFSDQFNQVFVPLAVDDVLMASVNDSWSCTPPFCPPEAIFINNIGVINPALLPNFATCFVHIPNSPALVGLTAYAAVGLLDPWANLSGVSPPITITVQ